MNDLIAALFTILALGILALFFVLGESHVLSRKIFCADSYCYRIERLSANQQPPEK